MQQAIYAGPDRCNASALHGRIASSEVISDTILVNMVAEDYGVKDLERMRRFVTTLSPTPCPAIYRVEPGEVHIEVQCAGRGKEIVRLCKGGQMSVSRYTRRGENDILVSYRLIH
jgi:hypothetical protein